MNEILDIIVTILMPLITAVAGWFAGNRKRRNDCLHYMQESITLLATENKKLVAEVVELRMENVALRTEVERLLSKLNLRIVNKRKSDETTTK